MDNSSKKPRMATFLEAATIAAGLASTQTGYMQPPPVPTEETQVVDHQKIQQEEQRERNDVGDAYQSSKDQEAEKRKNEIENSEQYENDPKNKVQEIGDKPAEDLGESQGNEPASSANQQESTVVSEEPTLRADQSEDLSMYESEEPELKADLNEENNAYGNEEPTLKADSQMRVSNDTNSQDSSLSDEQSQNQNGEYENEEPTLRADSQMQESNKATYQADSTSNEESEENKQYYGTSY
ncbi:hypothetical protein [Spirosoma sp. KUDC1026]|uniref:hypothetical protein n=1 Tax=Spirosoma sp. KUDC1026 TaxID=2745947 RepID=UPI00159BE275|nr:hypothetical protein [Spirosoma sp. KUDC1026]QKZ13777.1 hypothetical protein HU175_14520 [Spirosoma sp. KUDC1026]